MHWRIVHRQEQEKYWHPYQHEVSWGYHLQSDFFQRDWFLLLCFQIHLMISVYLYLSSSILGIESDQRKIRVRISRHFLHFSRFEVWCHFLFVRQRDQHHSEEYLFIRWHSQRYFRARSLLILSLCRPQKKKSKVQKSQEWRWDFFWIVGSEWRSLSYMNYFLIKKKVLYTSVEVPRSTFVMLVSYPVFHFLSNFMSLKPYFLILLVIFLSSSLSAWLLFFYLNPELDPKLAFSLMGIAILLAGSSFLAFFLFFLKKIYYRWDVTLSTMSASIRQGMLIMLGTFMMTILFAFHIFESRLIMMIWAAIACLEVMIQAVE